MHTRTRLPALVFVILSTSALGALPDTWPDPRAMEERIWQHLQENSDLGFTSIQLVKCEETTCELRFTGVPINDDEAAFDKVILDLISRVNAEKLPIRQVSTAKMDVSPGVPGIVVRFSSEPPTPEQTGHTRKVR
jgi:hypothetical protein